MWITIIEVLISAAHIFKISEGSDVESMVAFDRKGPIGHDILRRMENWETSKVV